MQGFYGLITLATVMVMIGMAMLKEMTTMARKDIMLVMLMMVTMFLLIDLFIKKQARPQGCVLQYF